MYLLVHLYCVPGTNISRSFVTAVALAPSVRATKMNEALVACVLCDCVCKRLDSIFDTAAYFPPLYQSPWWWQHPFHCDWWSWESKHVLLPQTESKRLNSTKWIGCFLLLFPVVVVSYCCCCCCCCCVLLGFSHFLHICIYCIDSSTSQTLTWLFCGPHRYTNTPTQPATSSTTSTQGRSVFECLL